MPFDPKKGGAHLGCVRNWIQWNATNGEQVTWGSNEPLQLRRTVTPKLLEDLACDIAKAIVDSIPTLLDLQEAWMSKGKPALNLQTKEGQFLVDIKTKDKEGTYLTPYDALYVLIKHWSKEP